MGTKYSSLEELRRKKELLKKEVSEKVAAPKTSRLKKATDEAAAEMKKIVESPKTEGRSRKKHTDNI